MESFTRPERCLNCLNPMPEDANFCSYCGQKQASPHDRSVWHLVVDSVGDFFHVDSKFIATLRPMLFRPGFLTIEYISGRKARYFHPFKLFLFLSFLYFLVSGFLGHMKEESPRIVTDTAFMAQSRKALASEANRGNLNFQMDEAYMKGIAISDDSLRKMVQKYGLNGFVKKTYPDASMVTRYMLTKVIKSRIGGNFGETMGKTVSKLVFVLILFFAFLLKLIYRKKKMPYFDHVIFSLHFLSFYFLLFMLKELLNMATSVLNPVILLALLVYLYFALHKVYPLKPMATFGKFILFVLGSLCTLLVFVILATALSFLVL